MKVLKKQMKRLEARRNGHMANPPKRSASAQSARGPQQHGINSKGNVAKFPGSMK